MEILIAVVLFGLGLSVGSFVNVVVYRLAVGKSVVKGRSFCPRCKVQIAWYDNIPLLSFLLLRGRCRSCSQKISWQYPVVEGLTGLLFVAVYGWQLTLPYSGMGGMVGSYLYWVSILTVLWVVVVSDIKYQLIYDEVLVFGMVVWVLGWWFLVPEVFMAERLMVGVLGVGVYFSFIGLIYWLSKGRAMGFGDVKLSVLLGLLVGWPYVILALQLAFLTGAIAGVILLVRGEKRLKDAMAFGPFLVLSAVVVVLAKLAVWEWYLTILNIK